MDGVQEKKHFVNEVQKALGVELNEQQANALFSWVWYYGARRVSEKVSYMNSTIDSYAKAFKHVR